MDGQDFKNLNFENPQKWREICFLLFHNGRRQTAHSYWETIKVKIIVQYNYPVCCIKSDQPLDIKWMGE